MRSPASHGKAQTRVAKFLINGPATASGTALGGKVLLDAGERGAISVDAQLLAEMSRAGIVTRRADGRVCLSNADPAFPTRLSREGEEPLQARPRDVAIVRDPSGRQEISVNLSESPLAQLARRRGKSGKPFLAATEVAAGERLRSDYTRGQIMPRLGANWTAPISSGRRSAGVADLTDAALAARLRVERAIEAVGPELAGVLIDVCCFLKGLERVEIERGWPVRSAKIVLKAALGSLQRHYEPAAAGGPPTVRRPMVHWGAEDYRPVLGMPGDKPVPG